MAKVEEKIIESKTTKSPVKKTNMKKFSEKKIEKSFPANKDNVKQEALNKKNVTKKANDDRTYSTGKRKNAIAKVWIVKGSGNITINGVDAHDYLKRPLLEIVVNEPFAVTETEGKFDVICKAIGGGLSGQAGAIRHGIAKALNLLNTVAYRQALKRAGLLTRDSRVVERKKAGLIKARKGQVFKRR